MPDHVPEPPQVRAGKQRIEQGERLRPDPAGVRPFFCRNCGSEQRSLDVPSGWYLLSRQLSPTEGKLRLGLYCSAACLTEQMPRLEAAEARKSLDELAASQYRQRLSRGRQEVVTRRIQRLQNRDIDLDNRTRGQARKVRSARPLSP